MPSRWSRLRSRVRRGAKRASGQGAPARSLIQTFRVPPASVNWSLGSLVGRTIEISVAEQAVHLREAADPWHSDVWGPKKRLVWIVSILGLGILGWLAPGLTHAAEALVEHEKLSSPATEAQPVILEGAETVYAVEGRYAPNGEYDSGGSFDPIGTIGPDETPRHGRVEHGDYDNEAFAPAYQVPSKPGDVSHGIH